MERAASECIRTEDFECEFIPPLDLPEARGLSWEQQLEATLAWQAAGGNIDAGAEASVYMGESGVGGERHLPTMRTITRMTTVLVALRERLQQIQIEAANVAIGEMALREASASGALNPEDAFSPLSADNIRRIDALAASCFELLSAARADLASIPGLAPAGAREGGLAPFGERRRHAMVIDFPDRRSAA